MHKRCEDDVVWSTPASALPPSNLLRSFVAPFHAPALTPTTHTTCSTCTPTTMHLGPSSPPTLLAPSSHCRTPLDITLWRIGVMPGTEAHDGYRHIVCPYLALGTIASVVASGAGKARAPSQQACE